MSAPSLPPLRDIIAAHGLNARKTLGQHFLLDLNLTRKIARAAEVGAGDRVLEIGPGPGGLTRALLETGADVVAIERDARCLPALRELAAAYEGRLTLVEGDALNADEPALIAAPFKIIANLPYNISTELLAKWLVLNHQGAPVWSRMALMFQKEVADRILSAHGSKSYGRLSVLAQAASRPERAFDLPARAFTPPPKVDSSVVLFRPAQARIEALTALQRVTASAFAQRRKMLRQSLKEAFGPALTETLAAAGVDPTARAEELTVETYLDLARRLG